MAGVASACGAIAATVGSVSSKWDDVGQNVACALIALGLWIITFSGLRSAWFYFGGFAKLRRQRGSTLTMGLRPWKWRLRF